MRKDACTATGGIYRPRNPRASPLYQCVARHYHELDAGGHFTRPVEGQVLARFLDCGDLHQGFVRVYCDDCRHDYLLAFSCKARYFCPSCHQKRMLAYGEWIEEHILAPVPHRQYVFALPKLLRPYFRQRRKLLARLCQIIAQLLYQGFNAMAPAGRPGFILYVQTFGDLVTFNPHVHALVADGVFYPTGSFRVLPPIPQAALEQGLRRRVLDFSARKPASTLRSPSACATGNTPASPSTIRSGPMPVTPRAANNSPGT